MSPLRKKYKPTQIIGSSIRFDEISNSYRHGDGYIYFGEGSSRIYDVPDAFLRKDVAFEVLSQVNKVIVVGNPSSLSGKISQQGLRVFWTLQSTWTVTLYMKYVPSLGKNQDPCTRERRTS